MDTPVLVVHMVLGREQKPGNLDPFADVGEEVPAAVIEVDIVRIRRILAGQLVDLGTLGLPLDCHIVVEAEDMNMLIGVDHSFLVEVHCQCKSFRHLPVVHYSPTKGTWLEQVSAAAVGYNHQLYVCYKCWSNAPPTCDRNSGRPWRVSNANRVVHLVEVSMT